MATAKKAAPAKRAPNAAFMKPMNISPALAAVIGATPIPRTEVTKKDLGIHQEKQPAGCGEQAQHQCRRQAESHLW